MQNPVPPPKPLRSSRKGRPNMSYDKVQVGNRIRGSRLEKGWTQEQLAAEAEISVQQLRALEKGQRMSCSGRTLSAGCDTVGAAQTQAVFKKLRIVPEEQQNTRLRIVCKAQYMGGCGFVVVCSHCQNRSKHNFCGVPSSRYRI